MTTGIRRRVGSGISLIKVNNPLSGISRSKTTQSTCWLWQSLNPDSPQVASNTKNPQGWLFSKDDQYALSSPLSSMSRTVSGCTGLPQVRHPVHYSRTTVLGLLLSRDRPLGSKNRTQAPSASHDRLKFDEALRRCQCLFAKAVCKKPVGATMCSALFRVGAGWLEAKPYPGAVVLQ